MTAAFRATFSDLKVIKTRQAVQLVFEVPLSDFDKAYEVLGGLPQPNADRWFGIAAIRSADLTSLQQVESRSTAGVKREWKDMQPQQQAGIRCDDITFAVFLQEEHPDNWHESMSDAAECVRLICGVSSRSELGTNKEAQAKWTKLNDQFVAWKAIEHA